MMKLFALKGWGLFSGQKRGFVCDKHSPVEVSFIR